MESWLLAQKAYIDAINADICGMVASNHYRLGRGETIAYGSTAFHDKAEELRGIGDQIMTRYYISYKAEMAQRRQSYDR